tara:strand:- start:243 stop:725 length:483 start_codon:yes stop_codon:yes gene_type:complete
MLPDIQIKDNFLTKKELKIVQNNIRRIKYTAVDNSEGNFGFRSLFEKNSESEWLFKKIKKQFFPNIDLVPFDVSYHLRHNAKKVMSHNDGNDYNFLLYVKGKELIYNGTGFYNKNQLHSYVGFVENRALFFDGKNNVHTDLQALGESSPRYTINIFYNHK